MKLIHKTGVIIKRAWRNAQRMRSQSFAVAFSCFLVAFLMLFTVLMYNSASLLSNITNLPYIDCYLYYMADLNKYPIAIDTNIGAFYGDDIKNELVKFEIVCEVFSTDKYEVRTDVSYFSKNGDVREGGGKLYWWVVPASEYENDFIKGERLLTSGRHITKEDHDSGAAVVIIDEMLAKANSISVGDSISVGEEKFTVVGLFTTVRIEKYPSLAIDMPQNAIFSSSAPKSAGEKVGMQNIYMRLRSDVNDEARESFIEYLEELHYTGTSGTAQYPYEYGFISVEELNSGYNAGVKTALSIATLSVISVVAISVCALYVMINIIINSRRREILLSKALGERRSNTVLTFLLEIGFVSVPSVALGIGVCYLACREYIKALFLHFASLMTPQSLRNTSSLVIAEHMGTAELLAGYTTPEEIALIAAVIFASIILLSALFIYIGVKRKQQEKTISLMSERKE